MFTGDRHHDGMKCVGRGGGKGRIRAGVDDFSMMLIIKSVNMVATIVHHESTLPATRKHKAINKHTTIQ